MSIAPAICTINQSSTDKLWNLSIRTETYAGPIALGLDCILKLKDVVGFTAFDNDSNGMEILLLAHLGLFVVSVRLRGHIFIVALRLGIPLCKM